MMSKIQLIIFVMALGLTVSVWADQAAYISKNDADRAVQLLQHSRIVKSYCAPCADKTVQSITIDEITSADVNYQGFWEVRINGRGEDLAYLYFFDHGRWRNVALTLKIPVVDVPEFIE